VCRLRALKVGFLAGFVLMAAASLWAKKMPEMPENFGQTDWAMANYKEAVGYLKYLTDGKTRKKMLAVPEDKRLETWENFWKKLDPVSATPENEMRIQYFARIRYANENFGTLLEPGWLTDRGEAYIRLGPPMIIDKYTMRSAGRDLEIWDYWTARNLYLFFLDRTGVGDFYLLNPEDMLEEVFYTQ